MYITSIEIINKFTTITMSTNALISVQNLKRVYLYKHYDGYPRRTLPWLQKFNKEFTERRGVDNSYKFAQLVRNSSHPDAIAEFGLDPSDTTGWGVFVSEESTFPKVGQEYMYQLNEDGTVTSYAVYKNEYGVVTKREI